MIRALCLAFSGLGIAALAWGLWQGGSAALPLALLLFGAPWLAAQVPWSRPGLLPLAGIGMTVRAWFAALGLVVTASAAAAGLLLGAPHGWMIVGALGGLLAWDLTDLDRRLRLADSTDDLSTIKRRHLAWLGLAGGIGLVLASTATLIPLRFSFPLTAFLALVAVAGMTRLVSRLYRG